MKCFSVIFLSLISALSQINAQNFTVDREVARAGNRPVYESEFRQRLEFVPQIGRTASDPDSVYKLEILYSMIGEKLLAQRGEELGLDTTIFVSVPVKYMEKLLVRDALYRIEILDKSRIDSAEFAAGIDRYFKKISAGYFYFNSEDSVYKIYSLLKQNLSPESIISKDNIYKDNFRKAEIKFGDLESEAEKKLFSLKKNQFTEPFRMGKNWYIFAVDSITYQNPANQKDLEAAEKHVRQIIRQRNSNSSYDDFYGKFFKNKKSAANSKLYNSFVVKIKNLYAAEKDKLVLSKDSLFSFSNQKALLIEDLFGRDSLNMVFINYNGSTLQLKEFVREFAFEGFTYSIKDTIPLERRLSARLKKYMEHQLLSQEGMKRGLNLLPDVKRDLAMWRDYYRFLAMKQFLYHNSSVTDSIISSDKVSGREENNIDKTKLANSLKEESGYKKLLEETQNLADRLGVRVDHAVLDSIKSSYIPIFVYRYYGFGGKFPAVPFMNPYSEWHRLWKQKTTPLF